MSAGWTEVALGELVQPVDSVDPVRRYRDGSFPYVDLSAVNQESKRIETSAWLRGDAAPSRARQLLRVGDVLVSTVRPNLNAVAVVGPSLDGAIGSTGFSVLRANGKLQRGYLFHWVRSRPFIDALVRQATGASYPAVSDRIVRGTLIPLPPLDEQRRIARVLDQVEHLRRTRRVALTRLDALTSACFEASFGDPHKNPCGWDVKPVSTFVSGFEGGKSFAGEDDDDSAAPYRVLRVSAVTSGEFRADESRPVPRGYVPPSRHRVRTGDLLISRANTAALVGAVALVDGAADGLLLPDKIWRFSWRDPETVVPEFVWQLFQTRAVRAAISRRSTGTSGSMKNISAEKLMGLELIQPPREKQLLFVRVFRHTRRLRARATRHLVDLDALFASLQHRAFTGAL